MAVATIFMHSFPGGVGQEIIAESAVLMFYEAF